MQYRALLFDFDYTLGDGTDAITECFNYAFAAMGIAAATRECVRYTVGMTLVNAYAYLTDDRDADKAHDFERLFKEKADEVLAPGTIIFPFAIEMLTELSKSDVKVGIISTKMKFRIREIFEKYRMYDMLDVVVGGDDVKEKKPAPEGLLCAMETLGVKKDEVLYIGDHVIDAQAAERAGVAFGAVLTGTSTREQFAQYPAKYIEENVKLLYDKLQAE